MGESIGGLNRAYDVVFELLSPEALKKIAKVVRPPPSLSSPPTKLRNEIKRFFKRNCPTRFYPELVDDIKKNAYKYLPSDLEEPDDEETLKSVMRKAVSDLGFQLFDKEVDIPPATRADIVGYRRRLTRHEKREHFWKKKEVETEKWYQFLGVELKTAKRGKDPLYRQAAVYAKYFDYAFTAVTPLTLIKRKDAYAFFQIFYNEMKDKGIGIVLMTKNRIIGTILASQENEVAESKRRYLVQEMELKT